MKKVLLISIFIIFFSNNINGNSLYIEINQMLGYNVGYEMKNSTGLGFRFGLGLSVFNIKSVSYSSVLFYELPINSDNVSLSINIGLPLAYFDLWEEKYLDWDPIIDTPYAGWLIGSTIKCTIKKHFSINLGAAYWIEWQEYGDDKDGFMPLVFLGYYF
ncbi:MAG: hypothetical protein OCD02_04220 [Spirochaetaceae bacterium]